METTRLRHIFRCWLQYLSVPRNGKNLECPGTWTTPGTGVHRPRLSRLVRRGAIQLLRGFGQVMSEVYCQLVNAMADSQRYGMTMLPTLPARGTILTVPDPDFGIPIHLRVLRVRRFVARRGQPARVEIEVLWN